MRSSVIGDAEHMRALLASASSIMFDSAFGEDDSGFYTTSEFTALTSCTQVLFAIVHSCSHLCSLSEASRQSDLSVPCAAAGWGRLEKSSLGVAEPTSFSQKRSLLSAREITEADWP